jgi:hypothetical protein
VQYKFHPFIFLLQFAALFNNMYDLTKMIRFLRKKGMFLAVEFGPLIPSPTCGSGVEGFTGESAVELAQNVLACGGTLDYVAFDEPFYYAHYYTGPNQCNWNLSEIATNAYGTVKVLRSVFPDVVIGDIEPVNSADPVWPQTMATWLSTYESVSGMPFSFFEWDVSWPNLAAEAKYETYIKIFILLLFIILILSLFFVGMLFLCLRMPIYLSQLFSTDLGTVPRPTKHGCHLLRNTSKTISRLSNFLFRIYPWYKRGMSILLTSPRRRILQCLRIC